MSAGLEVHSTRGRPALHEAALRLRHAAYLHHGHLVPRADGRFDDAHDALDDAESLLCTLGGQPVGTIRALRRAAGAPLDRLLSHAAFPDEVAEAVGDAAAIEFCRLAVASVRDEHLRFYTGFLGMDRRSAPRTYPGLTCAMSLLVGDLAAVLERPQPGLQGLLPAPAQLEAWRAARSLAA